MQFYENFIGHPTDQHFEEFSGSDTAVLFEESLITKPDDWYYRTHPISYIRNSNGHRCKELDNLDLDNYILYAGCSYTEGTGLELEKTYPYLVSKDLGTDYYNLALGGTGVDITSYNLIQWNNLVKAKPKALVIQWPSVARYGTIDKTNEDRLTLIGPWDKGPGVATFLTIGQTSSVSYFSNKKLMLQRLIKTLFTCPIIELEMDDLFGNTVDNARDPHPGIDSHIQFADVVKKREYLMRFDDLIKRPAKQQKPLTYTESLQAKLDAQMTEQPMPKFTALEWAIMEGGGSLETENFADGKNPQDKGDSKRHGVPTKASVSTLRKVAKQGGRKGQLAHWMANMKSGRAKK